MVNDNCNAVDTTPPAPKHQPDTFPVRVKDEPEEGNLCARQSTFHWAAEVSDEDNDDEFYEDDIFVLLEEMAVKSPNQDKGQSKE